MDTTTQHCLNQSCTHYQQVGSGNITIHSRVQQRFRCTKCHKTWVSHRDESHYKLKTDTQKIKRAKQLLYYGISIRQAAKLLQVSPSTIQRWKKLDI
jgi:transposase-like protein